MDQHKIILSKRLTIFDELWLEVAVNHPGQPAGE